MMAAEQYLNNNKKTLSKEKKKDLKNQISLIQKLTRAKKPEKMSEEELASIQAETAKIKTMMPEE